MNLKLKAVILKEVTEVLGRDYWRALVLYPILFSGMGFYIFNCMVNQPQFQDPNIINFALEFFLVIIPSFAMWLFNGQLIREKFGGEKLLRKFESILTTPVSLTTVWAGKIAAIFLLSYPLVMLTIIIFYLIWMILGEPGSVIIPSAASWVMIIFVGPTTPVVYASFTGWAILRFSSWERIIGLLPFLTIAIFAGIFFVFDIFLAAITAEPTTNWWTIIRSITGVIALFVLVFYLVSRLDREKVISA